MTTTKSKWTPKRHRNVEPAYEVPYEYLCGNGHNLGHDKPLSFCPVYIRGVLCDGALKRVGKGSRSS